MPEVNGQQVGPTGYGLMGLTWGPGPSDEEAFATMRAALAQGCNLWNGGEFYGPAERNSNVLLARYFARYPEDAARVVLCVKGASGPSGTGPLHTPEELRRSVDATLAQLAGTKKLDMFECARRNPDIALAETFGILRREYMDKGLVRGISLSECSAETIHEAVKCAKIAAVEVELSLWTTHVLSNGVAAACKQYGIPLIAYSPLGRGMLAGKYKTREDVPKDSFLAGIPRFQGDNFDINLQLVRQVEALAAKKGCTPAQLALSWVRCLGRRPDMPVIIPIPGASTAERVVENARHFHLSDDEMAEIDATLAKFDVSGDRYPDWVPTDT